MAKMDYDARNLYGNLGSLTTTDETLVDQDEMESLANEEAPATQVTVTQAQTKNVWLGVAGLLAVIVVLNLV